MKKRESVPPFRFVTANNLHFSLRWTGFEIFTDCFLLTVYWPENM